MSKNLYNVFLSFLIVVSIVLMEGCSKTNDVIPSDDTITPSKINWTQTNGPFGGSINAMLISGGNLLAGTENGLFISADNGNNWKKSTLTKMVFSLTTNGTLIFAGSYEAIYVSSDNGLSWSQTPKSAINGVVYCMTSYGTSIFASSFGDGVFVSTDNGNSWAAINRGLPQHVLITSLNVNNNTIFATAANGEGLFTSSLGDYNWALSNNGAIGKYLNTITTKGSTTFVGGDGVYQSTDGGKSWASAGTGLESQLINSLFIVGETIFAGTSDKGIFFSNNNGASWDSYTSEIKNLNVNCFASKGNDLFVGTSFSGIFHAADGLRLTPANNGFKSSFINNLTILDNTIFASSYAGLFKSNDQGATWIDITKNVATKFLAITTLSVNANTLFLGTEDGAYISLDKGNTWNMTISSPKSYISDFVFNGINIYAISSTGNGVYVSANNGMNWKNGDLGLPNLEVKSIIVKDKKLFAATGGGLFVSSDNAQSWDNIKLTAGFNSIYFLAVIGDKIIANTENGVFFSNTNGSNWTFANFNDAGSSFKVLDTNVFTGSLGVVYFSNPDVSNWMLINKGIDQRYVLDFEILNGQIFAATSEGVFVSSLK